MARSRPWFVAGFVLALGLVGVVALVQWQHNVRVDETSAWVARTHEVTADLNRLLLMLVDVETGARGYVVTGDPRFLEPFEASMRLVAGQRRKLLQRVHDDELKARLIALDPLIETRLQRARRLVALRRHSGFKAAQSEMASGQGRALMDRIRSEFDQLHARQRVLLAQRAAAARYESDLTLLATVCGDGAAFLLLTSMVALTVRENRLRREAEQALRDSNANLEQVVAERTAQLELANIELRRLVESLEFERGKLAAAFENSQVGFLISDARGGSILMNPAALRFLNYASAADIYQNVEEYTREWELCYPDGRPMPFEEWPLPRAVSGDHVREYDVHLKNRLTGFERICSFTSAPVLDGAGKAALIVLTFLDITEREQAEAEVRALNADLERRVEERTAALEALQGRYELIFNSVGEGLHGIDRDGTILFENPAAVALLGWDARELVGRPAHPVMHHTRADGSPYPQSECPIYATLRDGVTRRVQDEVFWRKDGSSLAVEYTSTPMRDGAGEVVGAVVAFRDVTERRNLETRRRLAEEALQQANQALEQRSARLEEANHELEAFSYSVSHDLRAPLRHIHGYGEMLCRAADGQLSGKAQRYLNTILQASTEMGRLIDDLLAFSRTGRSELREETVVLDRLLADLLPTLETALRDRRVVWRIDPLPPVTGDPALLRQVFANLLENAVKYTAGRDPAEIEIGCASQEIDSVVLFVRDNGVGFDMQYAGKLFGVFQRLHRAEEFEGTGIGLATARRILARHGGRIWAEAAPDQGATFFFTLRCASRERAEAPVPSRGGTNS